MSIRVAHSSSPSSRDAIAEVVEQLGGGESPAVVLFFVSSMLEFELVASGIAAAFPRTTTLGCTTCGEIGGRGCTTGTIAALALDSPTRAHAVMLEQVRTLDYERCVATVEQLLERAGPGVATQRVFVSLLDGLSNAEELLLAAISRVAPDYALVGGSAADDFKFACTSVALDGRVAAGGAVLLLLEPNRTFAAFHLHHYSRDGEPIVVTEAEPEQRLVTRFNGYPAVGFLAKLLGVDEATLRADPLATLSRNPAVFGFDVGGATFLRAVMTVKGDAVLLGGALEEGAMIYPMRAGELVEQTRAGIDAALTRVEQPRGLLLFNCGGRMWEAMSTERVDELGAAMLPIAGAGFTTYGEQFGPVQVNNTLTGLVLGD